MSGNLRILQMAGLSKTFACHHFLTETQDAIQAESYSSYLQNPSLSEADLSRQTLMLKLNFNVFYTIKFQLSLNLHNPRSRSEVELFCYLRHK